MSKGYEVRHYAGPSHILKPGCSLCSREATKEIFVEMGDFATRQRYCDRCLAKIERDIKEKKVRGG